MRPPATQGLPTKSLLLVLIAMLRKHRGMRAIRRGFLVIPGSLSMPPCLTAIGGCVSARLRLRMSSRPSACGSFGS